MNNTPADPIPRKREVPECDFRLRRARPDDATAVAKIYNWYIENTVVSFDTEPFTEEAMREKIEKIGAKHPFLIAEVQERVVGYAYASEFRPREAYRFSLENSIYLCPEEQGKGYGKRLLTRLIEEVGRESAHLLIAGITLPNAPSVRLHESLGFVKAAHFHEVGWKHERWNDVGFWELRMERKG